MKINNVNSENAFETNLKLHEEKSKQNLQTIGQRRRIASRPPPLRAAAHSKNVAQVRDVLTSTPRTPFLPRRQAKPRNSRGNWEVRDALLDSPKQRASRHHRKSDLQRSISLPEDESQQKPTAKKPPVAALVNADLIGNEGVPPAQHDMKKNPRVPETTSYNHMSLTSFGSDNRVIDADEESDLAQIKELRFEVVRRNVWGMLEAEEFWLRLDSGEFREYQSWAEYEHIGLRLSKTNNDGKSIPDTTLRRWPPTELVHAAYVELWNFASNVQADLRKKNAENEALLVEIEEKQQLSPTPPSMLEKPTNSHSRLQEQVNTLQEDNNVLKLQLEKAQSGLSENEITERILRKFRLTNEKQVVANSYELSKEPSQWFREQHEEKHAALRAQLDSARMQIIELGKRNRNLEEINSNVNQLIQEFQQAMVERDELIGELRRFGEEETRSKNKYNDSLNVTQKKLETCLTKYETMKDACGEAYRLVQEIGCFRDEEQSQLQLQSEKERMEIAYEFWSSQEGVEAATKSLAAREAAKSSRSQTTHLQKAFDSPLLHSNPTILEKREGFGEDEVEGHTHQSKLVVKPPKLRKRKPKPIHPGSKVVRGLPIAYRSPKPSGYYPSPSWKVRTLSLDRNEEESGWQSPSGQGRSHDYCPCPDPQPYDGVGYLLRSLAGSSTQPELSECDIIKVAHSEQMKPKSYCILHMKTGWRGMVPVDIVRLDSYRRWFFSSDGSLGGQFETPIDDATPLSRPTEKVKRRVYRAWSEGPPRNNEFIEFRDHERLPRPWNVILSRNPFGPSTTQGRTRYQSVIVPSQSSKHILKHGAHIGLQLEISVADYDGHSNERASGYMSEPVTGPARSRARSRTRGRILKRERWKAIESSEQDLEPLQAKVWDSFRPFGTPWYPAGSRNRPGYLDDYGIQVMKKLATRTQRSTTSKSKIVYCDAPDISDADVEARNEICQDQRLGYDLFYQMDNAFEFFSTDTTSTEADRFTMSTSHDVQEIPRSSPICISMNRIAGHQLHMLSPETSIHRVQPSHLIWWQPCLRSATMVMNPNGPEQVSHAVLIRCIRRDQEELWQCLANGRLAIIPASELRLKNVEFWPPLDEVLKDIRAAEGYAMQVFSNSKASMLERKVINIPIPQINECNLLYPVVQQQVRSQPEYLKVYTQDYVLLSRDQTSKTADTVVCSIFNYDGDNEGLLSKAAFDPTMPCLPIYEIFSESGFETIHRVIVLKRQGNIICCSLPDKSKRWFYNYELPLNLDSIRCIPLRDLWQNNLLELGEVAIAPQSDRSRQASQTDVLYGNVIERPEFKTLQVNPGVERNGANTGSGSRSEDTENTFAREVRDSSDETNAAQDDSTQAPSTDPSEETTRNSEHPTASDSTADRDGCQCNQGRLPIQVVPYADYKAYKEAYATRSGSSTNVRYRTSFAVTTDNERSPMTTSGAFETSLRHKHERTRRQSPAILSVSRTPLVIERPKLSLITDGSSRKRFVSGQKPSTPPLGTTLSRVKEEPVLFPPRRQNFPGQADHSENLADVLSSPVWNNIPTAKIMVRSPGCKQVVISEPYHTTDQASPTLRTHSPFQILLALFLVELHHVFSLVSSFFAMILNVIQPSSTNSMLSNRKKLSLLQLFYCTIFTWLFLGVLNARQDWLEVNGIGVVKGVTLVRGRRATMNGLGWEWGIWESIKELLC